MNWRTILKNYHLKKSLLYCVGYTSLTLLSLQTNKYSFLIWKLPTEDKLDWNHCGIKVNDNYLYLSFDEIHQIFKCQSNNGKIINIFGNKDSSSKNGEFCYPYGVTVGTMEAKHEGHGDGGTQDPTLYLYICDSNNHRIQILTKDKGKYITQWGNNREGQFTWPESIYYDELERIFFIGDHHKISIFLSNGFCIQRLGDQNFFQGIYGLCKIDDDLFVSDFTNNRIHIFRQKE